MPKKRIFILSPPRLRERRAHVLGQIRPLGLDFELIDGVDAKLVRGEVLKVPADAWSMSMGEVACYLSHIGMLQRICDYDLDRALILEDDFLLSKESPLSLETLWEHLPPDADHVQLHNLQDQQFDGYRMIEAGEYFNRVSPGNVGSWGYVVSRKLAEHILRHHQVPKMPIDHLYIELSKQTSTFNFYDCRELLVGFLPDIPSTLERGSPAMREARTFAEWWKERWTRY